MSKHYRLKMDTALITMKGSTSKPSFTLLVDVKRPLHRFSIKIPFFGKRTGIGRVEFKEKDTNEVILSRKILFLFGKTIFRVNKKLLTVGKTYNLKIT